MEFLRGGNEKMAFSEEVKADCNKPHIKKLGDEDVI